MAVLTTSAYLCIRDSHRNGQETDALIMGTCNTTSFDHMNMAACLNDALYLHQTLGSRQKLIYANYDPVPKVFPSDFLRERGFRNETLDAEARQALSEKFQLQSSE